MPEVIAVGRSAAAGRHAHSMLWSSLQAKDDTVVSYLFLKRATRFSL